MVTVARLSTSPVKSLGLSHPEQIRVDTFGVAENRRFIPLSERRALFDAKRHGKVMLIGSETDAEGTRLALRFPDGTEVADVVQLQGNPFPIDMWGRTLVVRLVGGPFAQALSEFVGEPVLLSRTERPGDGNDEMPVSLVSTASVEELGRQGGRNGSIGAGRLRMLLELEGTQPHEEDSWLGRKVRVGETLIHVARHCARCVITTMNDRTGEADFPTLKVIAAYRGADDGDLHMGMYASVLQPGMIRVGDRVEVLAV
ncbi:MAG: MOSC domain-containing protein [Actinomycetota bacterium]